MIKFTCINCTEPLEAPDSLINTLIDCPQCQTRLHVPPHSDPPAPTSREPKERKPLPTVAILTCFIIAALSGALGFTIGAISFGTNDFKDDKPKLYMQIRMELESELWSLVDECGMELRSGRNTRIGIVYLDARTTIFLAEATQQTAHVPTLNKIMSLATEIISLPRGYVHGATLYRQSGRESGSQQGEVFHADQPWAVTMKGLMNLEIRRINEGQGSQWLNEELINHEWCLGPLSESWVYPPGDYAFGIVPRDESGHLWIIEVNEVVGFDPKVTEDLYIF